MTSHTGPVPDPGLVFMAGFECSTHRRHDGRRLDLLAATGHDRWARSDYALCTGLGIRRVRDGLRWHLIEPEAGRYDWSSWTPMLEAAEAEGVSVIWDLMHYGWPDDLDIWSGDFVRRFAAFAAAATRWHVAITGRAPHVCPSNEISFLAWAGGEAGGFSPFTFGRGCGAETSAGGGRYCRGPCRSRRGASGPADLGRAPDLGDRLRA